MYFSPLTVPVRLAALQILTSAFAVASTVDEGLIARADPQKLQQIVLNLLTNAIKFTDRGGRIYLSCSKSARNVHIRVADTGRSTPLGQLARVFEPFVQVDQPSASKSEGVGLGLAMSRALARGMGGELTVESVVGGGSTFTISLPAL